jgi:hypothetical protein
MFAKLVNLKHRFQPQLQRIKPLERFTRDIQWVGNFNAPEAFYEYYFVDRQFGIIGELCGGMSPRQDTFYLCHISTTKPQKHRHYELSMLANIAQLYDVPITPMQDLDTALLNELRKESEGTFLLKPKISAETLKAEILSWGRNSKVVN